MKSKCFVLAALNPTTAIKQSPDLLYRLAIAEVIELFESQIAQINYTTVHLNNVWGAEDEGVQAITEKLNTMKVYIEEKMNSLKAIMDRDITPREYLKKC